MNDVWKRATGRLVVIKRTNTKNEEKDMDSRQEEELQILLEEILPENDLTSETTASVNLKIAGHEYYGKGTWDRVPYEVSVFCSFKVPCRPDVNSMAQANILARELAQDRAKESMGLAMTEHIIDIRTRLFKGLFANG